MNYIYMFPAQIGPLSSYVVGIVFAKIPYGKFCSVCTMFNIIKLDSHCDEVVDN